jgi:hypothetical protein
MDVTFSLTKEERQRSIDEWLGRRSARPNRSAPLWLTPRTVTIAWLILGMTIMGWQIVVYPPAFREVLNDLLSIVPVPLIVFVVVRLSRFLNHRYPTPDIEQTIALSSNALTRTIDRDSINVPWDDVTGIRLSDLAIVIMTEHYLDLVIPRRAFADPVKSIAFYRQAFSYWQPSEATIVPPADPTVWPPPPGPSASTNG